jgi:serine protease Do
MFRTLSRGAAAAVIAGVITAPLSAQVAAGGRSGRVTVTGDSVMVRVMGVGGKIDTVMAIARVLEHERYGTPAWFELTRRMDSLLLSGENRLMLRTGSPMTRGWIGFIAQGPKQVFRDSTGERVTYFAYPSIISVDPTSPADKAGIIPGDVLIAFNGTDVVGHEFNLTRMFEPEKKVGVTVRRDGESKEYTLDIVKTPDAIANRRLELSRVPMPPLPPGVEGQMRIDVRPSGERGEGSMRRSTVFVPKATMAGPFMSNGFPIIGPHGVFGADVSPVSAELAKVLKLEKGVLVNGVPEKSPAYKGGLRVGDVIVNALGQPVSTLNELQDLIMSRFGERSISLQIVRDKKPNKLTITW